MDTDEASSRYGEFIEFLDGEFARLDRCSRAYVVAEAGKTIVGFVRIWDSPHIREWVIDGLVVHPAHRRKGVAHRLILQALDLVRAGGGSSVISDIRSDNAAAARLHRRVGFHRETNSYLNAYGERRSGWGWQWRLMLPAEGVTGDRPDP